MMGLRKINRATQARQVRQFADAMGANTQKETYILGDGYGRLEDPDDTSKFLARKDDDAPVESFPLGSNAIVDPWDGCPVWIGWEDGERCILSMNRSALRTQGINDKRYNPADTRISRWVSKDNFGDFMAQAVGTEANPSTEIIVFEFDFIDERYQYRHLPRQRIDVASYIPAIGKQRLAMVYARDDLTIQIATSTVQNTAVPIDPTDVQECIAKLPPRAIPNSTWLLRGGMTRVTPADKHADWRTLFNLMPVRHNDSATTDPTSTDDGSKGYGVQSAWTNVTDDKHWICVDATVGAAIWINVSTSSSVNLTSPDSTIDIAEPTPGNFEIDVVDGQFAPADAKYIVQISDANLPNAQDMSALGTGLVKNTTGTGVQSIAVSGTDYTSPAGGENLSNKAITASSLVATALSVLIGGFKAIFSHANTADRTYTFPDTDGTVTLNAATQSISNKTITASSLVATALSLLIGGFRGIFTHSNTADRTYSFPDATTTLVGTDVAQTLSFKTLLTPIIASFINATHDHSNAAGGGNITGAAFGTQSANVILAGPTTGAAANPTFRAMVTADIPAKGVTLAKEADGTAYKFRGWDSTGAAAEIDGIIVSPATFTGSVSVRDVVYRSGSTWTQASNSIAFTLTLAMSGKLGFVASVSGSSGYVIERGPLGGFSGLTPGGRVYVNVTNGSITQTKPSASSPSSMASDLVIVADVGYALTSAIIMVDPKPPVYTLRSYLIPGDSIAVQHHADALEYTRKVSALVKNRVNVLAQSYASSNQNADIPLNALNLTTTLTVDSAGATTSGSIGNVAGVYRRAAQTFQVTATGVLDQITVSFAANVGTPSGTVTWAIEGVDGLPTGTPLTAGSTGTFTPTASANNTISIANGPTLTAGVTYALTLRTTNNQTSGNYWQLNVNAGNPYANGIYYIDTGTSSTSYNGTWNLVGTGSDLRCTFRTRQSYELISQSWSHSSAMTISQVRLWMKKVGSPTGDLRVYLYNNTSGNPNAIVSGTAIIRASTLSTTYGWVTFYFDAPFAYTSGTYHLVLVTTDSASLTNYVVWGGDTSSPSYANGDVRTRTNNTWSASPVADAIFELYEMTSSYTEAASVGAISQANTTLGVRYDDGSGGSPTTKTTFQNMTATGVEVVMIVEVS